MFDLLATAKRSLEAAALEFDAAALSGPEAARAVDELGVIRRLVDGMVAKAAKRVADTRVHLAHGERSAADFVARSLGVVPHEVRAAIASAGKLEELPAIDAAVRAGRLSHRQVSMITDVASCAPGAERDLLDAAAGGLVPLRDACLAARARVETHDARAVRQRVLRTLRMWTDDDGMLACFFRVPPERGARLKTVIEAEARRRFNARRSDEPRERIEAHAADALLSFVLDERDGRPTGVAASVHVVVDHGALVRGGAVEGETCEVPGVGPVSVAWARELLGSAFLTVVVKRGKDVLTVANVGRHIPAEVRTALIAGGRECEVEQCHARGYLERDHVHGYAAGGETRYENIAWLCYGHHRMKTDGWVLGPPDAATRKRRLRPPPGTRVA